MIRNCLIILSLSYLPLFSAISVVEAHPGRTAADGCHYCRTNCDKWGEARDERHCHGGGGSYTAPVIDTAQTQTVVPLPTNTPLPLRLPTKIPTRVPTRTPTPTVTLAPSPTATPLPTRAPTKAVKAVHTSATVQKPQGFFAWLFSLFSGR
jgi:hypothetical protein